MNKKILSLIILVFISFTIFANIDFTKADELYDLEEFEDCRDELISLEKEAKSNQEKSDLYWRLSRTYCYLGFTVETNEEKLKIFNEGVRIADLSLKYKQNGQAYLWKATNEGRVGTIKGPLNSLVKAGKIKKYLFKLIDTFKVYDSSPAFYVLAELYRQVPKKPFSFGNKEYAISYSRLAVETISDKVIYPSTYYQLAKLLSDRNWSASKRRSKFKKKQKYYNSSEKMHEKFFYYEGSKGINEKKEYSQKSLGELSDKEEAIDILNYAIKMYNKYPERREKEDPKKMKEEIYSLLNELT